MRGKKKPVRRVAKPRKAKVDPEPAGRRRSPTSATRGRQLEQRLAEALEQQAATSEILRVISRSPHDVQPVFDAIVRSAVRLCGGLISCVFRYDDERLHFVGHHNFPPAALDIYQRTYPLTLERDRLLGRAILERRPVNVADVFAEFRSHIGQRELGNRSILAVPMLRDGTAIGVIAVSRAVPGLFPEDQVALLETFADQAVIAIENTRLFQEQAARNRELMRSLEQQTATGEVLRVISSSPTDVQPVFEAIVGSAARLCEAEFSAVTRFHEGQLHLVAINNMSPGEIEAYHSLFPRVPNRGFIIGRAFVDGRPVHVEDVRKDADYDPRTLEVLQHAAPYRTFLGIPILRNGVPIGAIGCGRRDVKPFTPSQIELVKIFADQAVIAIENVRLFQDLGARNRDLTDTLDQQTATGEILRVISSSPTDVQPVFDTIASNARRLCNADSGSVFTYDGALMHLQSLDNTSPERSGALRGSYPLAPGPGTVSGRVILTRQPVHVADVREDADYVLPRLQDAGLRSVLGVPMLREGLPVGLIIVHTWEYPRPFTRAQIALLQTFADQAVIAIENVRLFTELDARNRELTETLEQQTATSGILSVISRSPTDEHPVFDAIVKSARRLCDASFSVVFLAETGQLTLAAVHGVDEAGIAALHEAYPRPIARDTTSGRAILDRGVVHLEDSWLDPEYTHPLRDTIALRSILSVPIFRGGLPIGAISVWRGEVRPFTRTQIELLKTFADQAVIAIENVRLFKELDARNRDLSETLEQQTATSELLKVIGRSTFDLQPVFETLVENAVRLCAAERGVILRFDGMLLRFAVGHNLSAELREFFERNPIPLGRQTNAGRAALERRTIHNYDVLSDPEYSYGGSRVDPYRTVLAIPMIRADELLGVILIYRHEVRPFTDSQVALMETFADQAAIAIENARLLSELQAKNTDLTETLEQQTATGEILRVISSSPTDVQPVFDTILRNAVRLCDARFALVYRLEGETVQLVAHHNFPPAALEQFQRTFSHRLSDGGTIAALAMRRAEVVHVHDIETHPVVSSPARELARESGYRSVLAVPIMRDGDAIGAIAVTRSDATGAPRPFSDTEIALLRTFTEQAVIAIENVRLFHELEVRNHDLTETLEQQTATSEILRVISSSPTDVQPVFDAIARSAKRLCQGEFAWVFTFDGQLLHVVAHDGLSTAAVNVLRQAFPRAADRGTAAGCSVLDGDVTQIPDVHAHSDFALGGVATDMNFRSVVAVPMLREGLPIGAIAVARSQSGLFSGRLTDLLKTFADQAVIAIENVRLFKELEARNRDLTETLEQQTATSELLKVIGRSTFDLQPVFETLAENAVRLCKAERAFIWRPDGEVLRAVVIHNASPELRDFARANPIAPGRNSGAARAALERRTIHIPDALADPDYTFGVREVDPIRTVLAIPMLRADELLGVIAIYRLEVSPFTDSQIALLETFADQAAIAIENARLLSELQAKNTDLTETLEQQTATSEILRVISSSPTDVQPVFDTIAQSAKRLCEAEYCFVFRFDGERLHFAAHHGLSAEGAEAMHGIWPMVPTRGSAAGRSLLDGRIAHIPDVHSEPGYAHGAVAEVANFRSVVGVPMMRDGLPIGTITVNRSQTGPFSDRQIALLQTFADQAVIAVENVRLFQELEARTEDLTRSVGELRALGEVSQAVSSTLDLETVLATIVSHAVQLSGSHGGVVYAFDEPTQSFHARATHQITPEHLEALRAAPIRLGEGAIGHAGVIREPVQIADIQGEQQLVAPQAREHLIGQGMRSLLAMPLIRDDRLLGGIVITRREVGAFSPGVVATLQTFAAQSVLAFQNARLFRESQRQKQYSEMLVETSPVAITTMDLRGAVVGWNPGAERLFGYLQAEALGHQMEDLVGTPEIREEVRANIRQTIAGEWIRAITRRARKNGTLVDVEISSMPVAVDGTRVGMIAIYHDITELLQARREAEAANEAKSAFLATMSHEIRTPMNAVIGMSGLLLNTALTDEQREYAEIVRQSGDTLLTVINDILDFSKIEAGRLELESQPFDVRECIESALDLVATRAAEKGIDLAYLIGEGTPAAVVGDVTRLRQVLLNLLSNAVKFTETGEVVLSVSARRRDGGAPLHDLTFSVRDTGIGIPPDRLDRLFQSFSQVDASTTRRYGGTGLGLAISQRLTELMGGRISVTSQVGAGSDFRFTIRAPAAESPLPARRDLSGVQPSLRGKRVLVVDDNATNRRILTAHLDAWGMRARATESPIEALAWVRDGERFDAAILDMHMPEMDGVALARAFRERPAGAALPLVLFTSLGRREARAEEAGFAAYLNKPIKPSQLFDALASILAEQTVHVPPRRAARSELDPEMAARHPLRILLAEDNVVNQKVALRILGQMGYRADVAANGLEAIEAVERQTYDVVLMDVQMPELDGFEASREINRRWPGERRPRLVAMTANAMEGDRELCMTAGMDDYVAKPIRVEELVAALGRCRPRGDAGPRVSTDSSGVVVPAAAGAIDRAAFERLTATMDDAFVVELIDTFLEDARGLIATLRRSLAAADRDAFRRAAHSLKSTSESLGAAELANLARELETIGRSGVLSDVGDRVERLAAQNELVTIALGALRHGLVR